MLAWLVADSLSSLFFSMRQEFGFVDLLNFGLSVFSSFEPCSRDNEADLVPYVSDEQNGSSYSVQGNAPHSEATLYSVLTSRQAILICHCHGSHQLYNSA
jgi:hypothetical protein